MAGYFENQFGKVPCNIVRPVRPQYTFFKALAEFKGKYIDELTYKEEDLIKYLGITIKGTGSVQGSVGRDKSSLDGPRPSSS